MSYRSLSSCSTGILGLIVALVWGEFQNFNNRNDIIPPIAADNKHIQISLDTHIFFTTLSSFAERYLCPYIDGLQLADSNFRAKVHHLAWEYYTYYR